MALHEGASTKSCILICTRLKKKKTQLTRMPSLLKRSVCKNWGAWMVWVTKCDRRVLVEEGVLKLKWMSEICWTSTVLWRGHIRSLYGNRNLLQLALDKSLCGNEKQSYDRKEYQSIISNIFSLHFNFTCTSGSIYIHITTEASKYNSHRWGRCERLLYWARSWGVRTLVTSRSSRMVV